MTNFETFKFTVEADGIALAVFDVPGRSMNTLTAQALRDIAGLVARLKLDAGIKGLVITSGKPTGFCAGADIIELDAQNEPPGSTLSRDAVLKKRFESVFAFNRVLRSLETCGKPVAAAINGLALGAGLEIALACHYRVCSDNPRIKLGLPEARIGLMPGAGGTQRLPRLIGASLALPLILEGKSSPPQTALRAGILHAVVAAGAEVAAAREWIRSKGDPVQPWDKRDYRIPGGTPHSPGGGQTFVLGNAMLRKQTFGNYPAQLAIARCVYEGIQVPIDVGLRIESRYVAGLVADPTSRNMMRGLFLSPQELGKGAHRPKDMLRAELRRIGVIGAGAMGAGIAFANTMAGLETVLIDTTIEAAERGKAFTATRLAGEVERGRLSRDRSETLLRSVTATIDYAELASADLVIESVYENHEIKSGVLKNAASAVPGAVFASNTSSLSISDLAGAIQHPENFIGLHFFAPPDRMALVELVLGKQTSERTLATAMDYVRRLRRTPIVARDVPGFFIQRCFTAYMTEGEIMVAEGIAPAIVENVGRIAGMSRGPLDWADETSLDLAYKRRKAAGAGETPLDKVTALLESLVVGHGRYGRKNGKGFYDHPAGATKSLWPGLSQIVPVTVAEAEPDAVEELKKRLLYIQAIEAVRCLGENVIGDPREADVAAIQAWGYPSWTGGPLSLIDTVGPSLFLQEADRLAKSYGQRFAAPALLRDMVTRGATFYGAAEPAPAAH